MNKAEGGRHDQLIQAGWHYDPDTDRYRAPGSKTDGSAVQYNLDAAWRTYIAEKTDAPRVDAPPATRSADPRRKEPE